MKYLVNAALLIMLSVSNYAETSQGIIIYTRKGCGRCEYTVNYLKIHNISYMECLIEDEKNYNDLCGIINRTGQTGNVSISIPVIIKGDSVYYSIDNLEAFVKSLSDAN